MRHPAHRRRQRAAEDPIRDCIEDAILHRQALWCAELHTERPNWVTMLGLHLQISELQHLAEAIAEFAS